MGLLRPLVERHADDPELQKSYARANQLAGDKVRAAEAYAEAAYLTGHAEDALNQLKALSKQTDLTYYQRSRIDARITQLTPAVLELRKRGAATTPDSLLPARCRPAHLADACHHGATMAVAMPCHDAPGWCCPAVTTCKNTF